MVGRVFITDAAGANPQLRAEIAIPTATASDTAVGATVTVSFPNGLPLLEGQEVQVAISVYAGAQDQMDVFVEGGEFS